MLTCQQLTELLTEYSEGRMSFWRRAEFHMHLGMCAACRAFVKQMRLTVQALGVLPAEPMPADVQAELLARFAAMPPKK